MVFDANVETTPISPVAEDYSSSESDGVECIDDIIELRATMSKWTNYIHGWQARYIVLKDGTLSYYKSESESDLGCRGAISLSRAVIKCHEFDECRFDVSVNNNVWYLRAENSEDRGHWVEVLQSYKSDLSSGQALRRHDSAMSLHSTNLSTVSGSSLKRHQKTLKEKVGEIETFKDILVGQIDGLQKYFDACAKANNLPVLSEDGVNPLDYKGEALTFKATTAGVITILQHCLDIIAQRDESWKRKLDKEGDKIRKLEEINGKLREELEKRKNATFPGPDFEEGPHSTLPEDEFFDAVESGLDKIEEDRQLRVKLKYQTQQSQTNQQITVLPETLDISEDFGTGSQAKSHPLWSNIDKVCTEQLRYAREGVGEGGNGWQIFADEGEMKMYKREEEVNGMVMDPLKACHVVKGVTAREMCHYFFMPEYRNDWETTLEECTILEKISPDTLVFLQTHKRVWPASQRDALFWSHMRKITDGLEEGTHDSWVVCNNSTEREEYPPNSGKCIRIFLTVILVCQTIIEKKDSNKPVTRDDLTCKITYCSVVNPGGWAPASALRAIYKREYPKFLKRYTGYVIDQCKDKPIMF